MCVCAFRCLHVHEPCASTFSCTTTTTVMNIFSEAIDDNKAAIEAKEKAETKLQDALSNLLEKVPAFVCL